MRRDMAVALSLANLGLLKVFERVAFYGTADAFYMKHSPGAAPLVAAVANLILLGAVIWALLRASRSSWKWLALPARLGLIVAALAALNSIRAVVFGRFPALRGAVVSWLDSQAHSAAAAAAILALAGAVVASQRLRRLGAVTLLSLTPLVPLTLATAASRLLREPVRELVDPEPSPRIVGSKSRNRVVWVVFDEWDFRRAFEHRATQLRTPNLDRLARESLFASQAYSPASRTLRSITSLLAAERFVEAENTGPAELLVRRAGQTAPAQWNAGLTVLARARAAGINTAAAGWYLPYCRILAPVVSACHWCEMAPTDAPGNGSGAPIAQAMAGQMRGLVETAQFSVWGRSQGFERHARSFRELLDAGLASAADPELGFVFLHLPIPHAPYLRRGPDGTLRQGDYASSLALVDETVGRLVDAMVARGVWQSTHLLLSADHSLRGVKPEDRRVPFLLRLAGDKRGLAYSKPFVTVVSGELLLAALRGEIATHEAAAGWLDSRP